MFTEWGRASDFDQLLLSFKPGAVYVNTSVSLAAVLAARRQCIPVIWHLRELFDDLGGELKAPAVMKPLVRMLFAGLPQQVITNSKAVAKNLLGMRSEQAVVIYNAVDDSYFDFAMSREEARAKLGLETEGTIIGVPGTLRARKGHGFFFKAASQLCLEIPDIYLAISGGGDEAYREQIEKQVLELGLNRQVIFLGPLDGLEVFFRACDVVCVPSEAESFGRVVVEAMAIGTPVVATKVGGIPEVLEHDTNGLLVSYGDIAGMAKAFENMYL